MQSLTDPAEFDALAAQGGGPALVLKHSTRCPISAMAFDEVERLEGAHPEVPVYLVDVIADRDVSRHVAQRTGVAHHSPQLILLVHGEVAWDVSHFEIRAERLGERLNAVGAGREA